MTKCLSTKLAMFSTLASMRRFARIFAFALIAMFAAGTVVHAASATVMSVKVALSDGDVTDMAGCAGCRPSGNDEASNILCDAICISPFSGTLNAERNFQRLVAASPSTFGEYKFVGRIESPDPYPPRSLS
ncbi:MAG: hypothetical protein RLQ25_10730 [Alphaproteobacteria bacterium]|uniref:hypothetical protein n=1 Tax=Marinobacter salarius TaxID=1420917 RepID=UPI0032EF880B